MQLLLGAFRGRCLDASAPSKFLSEQSVGGDRGMEGSDSQPRVRDVRSRALCPGEAGGVNDVDDLAENRFAPIPPAGGVQRHAEFRVTLAIKLCERHQQPSQVRIAASQPVLYVRIDPRSHPAAGIIDQGGQQPLAIPEMMRDAGIGHSGLARHRADLNGLDTTFGQ